MIRLVQPMVKIRRLLTVLGTGGLFVGAACLADDIQNRRFLETLPRDRRALLSENLDRFNRLSSDEQTAIRRLDKEIAEIASSNPVEQARYRALLHHYHLWFQELTDEQRTSLFAISDFDERFRLAQKLRRAETSGPKRGGPRIAKIRIGEFGIIPPFEAAFLLKVWQALPPEKRAEIEKKSIPKLREELRSQAKKLSVALEAFTPEQEKTLDEKLENDDEFKPFVDQMIRNHEKAVREGKVQKKADTPQKRYERPFAEFLYFEENRPHLVDPTRLTRFGESCPEWFHSTIDSLSADDARDYLTILYRLIYPLPTEMPESTKPTKSPIEPASKKAL